VGAPGARPSGTGPQPPQEGGASAICGGAMMAPVAVAATPEPQVVGATIVISAADAPAREVSGLGLSRGNARLPGQLGVFSTGGQAQAITREQLLEQGVSASQADALMVRQHEQEVFEGHFRCWILACGVPLSLVVWVAHPAMLGLLVWLVVANVKYLNTDCDAPLQMWVRVVLCIVLYNSTINRPSPQGSCVHRTFCGWRQNPDNPQRMPLRVIIYQLVVIGFTFGWNCAGLHWISIDGKGEELPACKDAAPMLYEAVKVYAACNLAITLFMYINMFGFAQVLRIALRRGLLRTSNAAPSGSLEKNAEVVSMNDPAIQENPSCSICLEDFDKNLPMVKTKLCGHVFHKGCLKGWLQVSRSCPLCREDLGRPPPATQAWLSSTGR